MNPLLSKADLEDFYGLAAGYTTEAGIALADDRQVQVCGLFGRNGGTAPVGRAGVASVQAVYTFPTHLCEDVREGDLIQVAEVDYDVRGVTLGGAGTTTLQLRRRS